ncbi:MAG: 3-phosphoglycerate dehydrogenase [Gammaproteobacteria bacterium]|nr:MAG: 3-phosphoglycerate dehydrogenase [Gammaproteobacteria bacterium]
MKKILTLNNISPAGLELLPRECYEVASEIQHPDAILLRSFKMHDMPIPSTLKAVGRAGAGVNNIPVQAMSERGIPVFNAPGANANAVKELVIAGLLIASRNICQAWQYARSLEGDDDLINKMVEQGKKQFAGIELPGRKLGVIGLGAIGRSVANTAVDLGMEVFGYDPGITVQGALKLSTNVNYCASVDELLSRVDFVTLHVPLVEATRNKINRDRIQSMPDQATILNFSRQGIVDDEAVLDALDSGKLRAYICDFPTNRIKNHPKVVALPHLGASTLEAEENCAKMVVRQVRDFLEKGNIRNSVNFPEAVMEPVSGTRLAIANSNIPNMLGQISTVIANAGLNIIDMLNRSRDDLAYTLLDIEGDLTQEVVDQVASIEGVLMARIPG